MKITKLRETNLEQLQLGARLIQQSNHIVALTGAGLSIPSGIPDFRNIEADLWSQANPLDVASIFAFRQHPTTFYEWARPLANTIKQAKPHKAHYALVQLEQARKLQAIITQNIDGLHQAAGSKQVCELHGHNRTVTCTHCYTIAEASPIFEQFLLDGQIPHCNCGGVWKPNVTLFGEQHPIEMLHQARSLVAKADLIIVVGSSLEVAPISDLPHYALAHHAKIMVINQHSTYFDSSAALVITGDLIKILPKIVHLVLNY